MQCPHHDCDQSGNHKEIIQHLLQDHNATVYDETDLDITRDGPLDHYTLIKKGAHGSHIVTLVEIIGDGDERTIEANSLRMRAPMNRGNNRWRDIRTYPSVKLSMRSDDAGSATYCIEYRPPPVRYRNVDNNQFYEEYDDEDTKFYEHPDCLRSAFVGNVD